MDRYRFGSYLKALRRFETYVWLGLIVVLTFMLTSFGWWLAFGRPTYLPITTLSSFFAQEETQPTPSPTPAPQQAESDNYTVQRGDSLWILAQKWFGDGSKYHLIVAENQLQAEELEVGQVLRKPVVMEQDGQSKPDQQLPQERIWEPTEQSEAGTYTVKSGDSLWKISMQQLGNGYRWLELYKQPQNRKLIGRNPNLIYPGQQLQLPPSK